MQRGITSGGPSELKTRNSELITGCAATRFQRKIHALSIPPPTPPENDVFRVQLLPRKALFFDLFEAAAANMVEAARCLEEFVDKFDRLEERARAIKDIEHRSDLVTHQVMNELRKTFVPPFEREDIAALAESLDDVIDYIEDAAARMVLYKADAPAEPARHLTRIIVQVAEEIQRTLPLLRSSEGMRRILPATVEINRLENEADDAARRGLTELFENPYDVLHVIKWREIYEVLEGATDRGEDVANVLEGVVLKHS